MTQRPEITQAQHHLDEFLRHSAGQEEHEALMALEKGLVLLTDIRDNSVHEKDRTGATNLFNTYASETEKRVIPLLQDIDSVTTRVCDHWYHVMKEYEDCGFPLPDSFIKKENSLLLSLLKRQIPKLPKAYQLVLNELFK